MADENSTQGTSSTTTDDDSASTQNTQYWLITNDTAKNYNIPEEERMGYFGSFKNGYEVSPGNETTSTTTDDGLVSTQHTQDSFIRGETANHIPEQERMGYGNVKNYQVETQKTLFETLPLSVRIGIIALPVLGLVFIALLLWSRTWG